MGIDLSRFKVVYKDKVLNAVSLQDVWYFKDTDYDDINKKPEFIEILVINENGNIEAIRDESWEFQFLPIISK